MPRSKSRFARRRFMEIVAGLGPAALALAQEGGKVTGGGGARTLSMTNLTGHPSVVVPCGFRQGLPVGLVFTSNLFDEGAALRLALQYQSATDWHKQRPPIGGPLS